MSISNYLSNLNAYYSKITALIENIVYINDFGNENTNIADGGNDLFDTANQLIFVPYDTEADLIPYTHTQTDAGGEDGINYTDPPMDGVVADGADYGGGNDSQYFTNMYPGLFVFVGTNLEASAFTVYGNMGSDGEEIVTTDDGNQSVFEGNIYTSEGSEIKYLGQTYTVFTRFSQDEDEDPTLNHIIIVKGSGGTHEYTGSEQEDYYDEVNLEDNNNDYLYLNVHINHYYPWYKRLWLGIKYIFGSKIVSGVYDELMFDRDKVVKLRDKLDSVLKKMPK